MKVYEKLFSDVNLQTSSIQARGLMIVLMPYLIRNDGKLLINGQPILPKSIVIIPGCGGMEEALSELIEKNVFSVEGGIVESVVFKKHNDIITKRREAGKLGGNPKLKKRAKKEPKEDPYSPYPKLLKALEFDTKLPPYIKLAKKMHEVWEKMYPSHVTIQNAKTKNWSEECRWMNELDKRPYKDIWETFEWVVADIKFWAGTISSPKGLRANYDTILQGRIAKKNIEVGIIKKQTNFIGKEDK